MAKIQLISTNKEGFRLSQVDIVFIIFIIIISYILKIYAPINIIGFEKNFLSFFALYVMANFFLFCNVFRVKNKYELYWLVIGTINIGLNVCYYQNEKWFFISQSCFTLIVILLEMKDKNYHGIFCKTINKLRNKE